MFFPTATFVHVLRAVLVLIAILGFFTVMTPVAQAVDPGGFVTCEGTGCSFCQLVSMGNTIIVWVIGILFLIFAGVLIYAGFQFLTSGGSREEQRSDAKKKITNALVGILIVIAAWLMVDTLLRVVLPGDAGEITGLGSLELRCLLRADRSGVLCARGCSGTRSYSG